MFHTDAVPAVGHLSLDVRALGIDLLSASAHKFNGPKGTGFLFVRDGVDLPPLFAGGAQENNRRAGTENTAAIVGMAAALTAHCRTLADDSARFRRLSRAFHNRLKAAIPTAIFNDETEKSLPGLISVTLPGVSAEGMLHLLDLRGIAVSTGAACNADADKISHVLTAIGLDDDTCRSTLRISFGYRNTLIHARQIADAIGELSAR